MSIFRFDKMKKLIRIASFLLLATLIFYIVVALIFGGFSIDQTVNLAMERGDRMLLFAHRGILNYFPEHSMEGAHEAKRLGFNAIEIDIRKSADDSLIVFHDETTDRLLGIKGSVDSISFDVLQSYPLMFRSTRTKNYILSVDRFFNLFKDDFIIYCDMKLHRNADADKLIGLIRQHSLEKTCIVASADIGLILYIKMKHPEIKTALEGFDSGKEWTYRMIPKNLRPDFLSGFFQNVDSRHMHWLGKMNLLSSRIVYGIDSSNYEGAKELGIRNMILDYDSSFGDMRREIRQFP